MRRTVIALLPAVVMAAASARGQGTFQNLDFEAAKLDFITNASGSISIATSNALPGWSAFAGTSQLATIYYQGVVGFIPAVELQTAYTAISGNFSVFLDDGYGSDPPGGIRGPGLISQTGLIPADAESLFFEATTSSTLLVSLDGQNLPYLAVSSGVSPGGLNYTVFGANIAMYAGQAETLAFTGTGTLDDIQFSSSPVPEPGGLALLALGGGVLLYARVRKRNRT